MKYILLYDLKGKNNKQRTRIFQKIYGHKDNSNYDYSYNRKGLFEELKYRKEKKIVLYLKNRGDLEKAGTILKKLKVKFESLTGS